MFMNWNNLFSECKELVSANLYDIRRRKPSRRAPKMKISLLRKARHGTKIYELWKRP